MNQNPDAHSNLNMNNMTNSSENGNGTNPAPPILPTIISYYEQFNHITASYNITAPMFIRVPIQVNPFLISVRANPDYFIEVLNIMR